MKSPPCNFYPLQVHTWGGFGSQIYGLAVAKEIRKSCRRKIQLVLHTGGVTERKAEIYSMDSGISISTRNDYSPNDSKESSKNKKRRSRFFIKFILLRMRIILDDSNLRSNLSIKPWTHSLRGHYTQQSFSRSTLQAIANEIVLQEDRNKNTLKFDVLIHYRLGDLLTLESKSPIDAKYFTFIADLPGQIYVVSDSPEIAASKLSAILGKSVQPLVSTGGRDVINFALNSELFIGSSSKVSDWAILYRLLLRQDSVSYAPASRRKILNQLCNSFNLEKLVYFSDY